VRILAVSGSLRADSHNTSLLRAAIEAAPDGVELELWHGLGELPIYDQDLDDAGLPEPVRRLRAQWGSADAILFATPEYNGSVPGGLKNAIDWASRPALEAALTNRTVAVIGASTGQFGAMWAQADLRKILGVAGARVVGDELPVTRAHERFDAHGRLLDGELFERLRLVLATLAHEAAPVELDPVELGPVEAAA
jgi:chromate reductase, NAD(P)H dehydrogenase (quinone)